MSTSQMLQSDLRFLPLEEWLSCGACVCLDHERVLLGWGTRAWLAQADQKAPSFFAPQFFLQDNHPWFIHEYTAVIPLQELRALLSLCLLQYPRTETSFQLEPLDRSLFDQAYADAQRHFAAKELSKAVVYNVQKLIYKSYNAANRARTLSSLLTNQASYPTYAYGFWDEDEGMLGSTPEMLFSLDKEGTLHSMACAGTQSIEQSPEAFLLDSKIAFEHQCVVDGICRELHPFGNVQVGKRGILDLQRMRHMMTPIEVSMREDVDFCAIVKAMHPTPALGAFPKEAGDLWLRCWDEKIPRKRFGAPFGCQMPEEKLSVCYVAIRNVQWCGEELSVYAGCGIVSASDLEGEWNELQLKLRATQESLMLHEG